MIDNVSCVDFKIIVGSGKLATNQNGGLGAEVDIQEATNQPGTGIMVVNIL